MTFLAKLAKNFLSPALMLTGVLDHKKKPKLLPAPVTRDIARDQLAADDELRRRQGAAADMITGTQGAEAGAGSVGRLVAGN